MVSTSRETSPSPPPTPIYTHATRKGMNRDRRVSVRLSSASDRSKNDLAKLLLFEEREAKNMRNMLLTVTEQLKDESRRADDNERRAREAVVRFKAINDARLLAQQDAARANEELRLYKIQLENAQREIFKAQEILNTMEDQRYEAEASAARARSTARKIKEQRLVELAREEGRRLGMQEGLNRGRRIGFDQARTPVDDDRASRTPSERYFGDDADDLRSLASPPRQQQQQPPPPPLEPIAEPMLNFPDSPTVRGMHPVPMRNTPTPPRHPETIIPMEGFIPHADADSMIRLPPPHEMQRPVSPFDTPRSSVAPLMIPDPAARHDDAESPRERHGRHEHRRPASPSSPGSTTISQFELVSDPSGAPIRPSRMNRRSLSVIPEAISGTTTPVADGTRSLAGDGGSRPSSTVPSARVQSPRGSPHGTVPVIVVPQSPSSVASNFDDPYVYRRPSFASSTPGGSIRTLDNRASRASSVQEYTITVEPPSRSTSQTPQATPMTRHREFLSAEDAAHRPIPVPSSPRSVTTPLAPSQPLQYSPNSTPIVISELPPGFVPLGPAVASPASRNTSIYAAPGAPTAPPARAPSAAGMPMSMPPAAVPAQALSSASSRRSRGSGPSAAAAARVATPRMGPMPVVPDKSLLNSRSRISTSSSADTEDEEVASSLASSNDTLSTPPPQPARRRKKPARAAAYDAAPEGDVHYPKSPLMGAAGAPLPAVGGPYGRPGGNAGMTPAARHSNLGGRR
ncbi:hypothetical protein FA95DRAFT_1563257 [Auriscalpium vulgare]|uniref:Uncharacterized protein n=1 Tax=Auriscalpium vulgare TaxID=40419 RepID=A0ACB8RHF6_9AGAM|nr:hypothetical protein FA95DRAFT_1563257 [Auriscalpium vulgare]